MNYINLNGKIVAAQDSGLPIDNGAFRYGYGLFETMLVQDGAICLGDYHWQRLFAGAKQLYFELPALMTATWLEKAVLQTVRKNRLEHLCRVRLQLFAAGGGLYSNETRQPGFVIECFPLEQDTMQLNENGIKTGIAQGLSKSVDTLSNLKSCNALIYAMAARQAKENKWNDALIANTAGNIIESTLANIFWIKDKTVYTPPLADGCVAGVMRRRILETISVKEKSLTMTELLQADEVFLTNAIKRMRWVSNIGDSRYSRRQVSELYRSLYGPQA